MVNLKWRQLLRLFFCGLKHRKTFLGKFSVLLLSFTSFLFHEFVMEMKFNFYVTFSVFLFVFHYHTTSRTSPELCLAFLCSFFGLLEHKISRFFFSFLLSMQQRKKICFKHETSKAPKKTLKFSFFSSFLFDKMKKISSTKNFIELSDLRLIL